MRDDGRDDWRDKGSDDGIDNDEVEKGLANLDGKLSVNTPPSICSL